METLGYLHLACINELSENPTSVHSTARIRWKFPVEIWVKFLSIATSLAILSLANAAMALLQEGDRGLEVGSLQRQLASQGCYSGEIDDVFGPQTRVAVVACQRKFGLDPDGMAGERTLAALAGNPVDQNFFSQPFATTNLSDTTGAVLRQGSEGSAVSDLQERLTAAGFSTGTIDGIFGAQTDAAVRSFQRSRDLIPDGVVGDQVYQALDARTPIEPSATRPLSTPSNSRQLAFNTTGADVKELQRRLTSAGYAVPQTGYYGDLTRDAVLRFQASRRLRPTGVADAQTLNLLGVNTAGSFDRVNRYYVAIPSQGADTLSRVRQFFPRAVAKKSRLGDYVEAGAYPNVERAEQESNFLRTKGLDARVAYR